MLLLYKMVQVVLVERLETDGPAATVLLPRGYLHLDGLVGREKHIGDVGVEVVEADLALVHKTVTFQLGHDWF